MTTLNKTETETYTCHYCGSSFRQESTLTAHACEQKRRHLSRNNQDVSLGLHTYVKFYKFAQDPNKTKTFEEFVKSPYYSAFVKFAGYCLRTRCIKIEQFIDWVIRSNIKLDKWASDATYTKFLETTLKTENPLDALARAFEYSIEWGEEKNMRAEDIFRYGNTNLLCQAIVRGSITPWAVYQSDSGQEFLGKLNEEQMQMIWDIVDPDHWALVFEQKKGDTEYVREILREAGW